MILVTGAKGRLGRDVCSELEKLGIEHKGICREDADLADKNSTKKVFSKDVSAVIHCAAYTAVDKAEEDKENCFLSNVVATRNLCELANENDAKFLFVSTDYVFGSNENAVLEVSDKKNPINEYGRTKLLAENEVLKICKKHFIVRPSWVFGEKNTNFIATMLRLSKTRNEVSVVCDRIGSPTYSKDLAKLLVSMIQTEKYGIYHATNEGFCSWAELAELTFKLKNINCKVIPVKTEEYKTAAKRAKNSRLSKASLSENGFELLPTFENAVERYLKNIKDI